MTAPSHRPYPVVQIASILSVSTPNFTRSFILELHPAGSPLRVDAALSRLYELDILKQVPHHANPIPNLNTNPNSIYSSRFRNMLAHQAYLRVATMLGRPASMSSVLNGRSRR